MKNLKNFVAIAIILASIFISCSKDEKNDSINPSNVAKFNSTELNSLKSEFITIMSSPEYKTFHDSVNKMVSKMKDEKFTFQNRQDFVDWINTTGNLSKTNFSTADDAIKLCDRTMTALVNLRTKYETFYDNLIIADTEEFFEICAPEMVHPALPSSEKSCVNACIDAAETAFHIADITYQYAMDTGDFWMIMGGTIAYNAENAQITQNYINCFGGCPV